MLNGVNYSSLMRQNRKVMYSNVKIKRSWFEVGYVVVSESRDCTSNFSRKKSTIADAREQ